MFPPVLWDFYNNGCSVRMLNPQSFHPAVWRLCSTLQDHFGSMVGANVYLTPPGTQGFAPHWDDVEVFMCQLEGSKHWRLYGPREEGERLPRFSSPNLSQDEVGEPILETVLHPGDMLYLPRGTIHQGNCLPEEHSLHITISCYQLNSWTDLLEKLLPAALASTSAENAAFREGLPRDYLSFMGVAHEPSDEADSDAGAPIDVKSLLRKRFLSNLRGLVGRLTAAIEENADAACDQMRKRLMSEVGLLAKYHPELSCHDDTVVSLIIVRECTRHSSPDDAKNSFYTHHNEKNSSNYQQALPPALEMSERETVRDGML